MAASFKLTKACLTNIIRYVTTGLEMGLKFTIILLYRSGLNFSG